MSDYSERKVLKDMPKESIIKLCMSMHPEMSKKEVEEKLTNGEGVEFNMGYAVSRIREIVSKNPERN